MTILANIEAEKHLLGSILIDNDSIYRVCDLISSNDFYDTSHKTIYSTCISLLQSGAPIDLITVVNNTLNIGVDPTYISSLVDSIPSSAKIEYYANIIKSKSIKRSVIDSTNNIINLVTTDSTDNIEPLLQKVTSILSKTIDQDISTDILNVSDEIQNIASNILEGTQTETRKSISGFRKLDSLIKGFHSSDLVIVAGRPAMGKTSFALNIIEHAAIVQQKPIALFSLEMSSTQIMHRLLYSMALTSSQDAKKKSKSINEASAILKNSKIFIDDKTNITINDINLKCKKLKREQGIEMVVIDYLQLMGGGNSQSREREISEISRGLKCLAKELQIPVIALSQLNRSLESRFDKRPIMSDLRESGAIEQDADLIIFLYRDEVYNKSSLDRSLAEVIVSKHRSGPIGTIKLGFVDQYTKFFDLA